MISHRSVFAVLALLAICLAPLVAQTLAPSLSAVVGQNVASAQAPPDRAPASKPAANQAERPMREARQLANVKLEVTIADQVGSTAAIKKALNLMVADGYTGAIRSYITIPPSEKSPTRRYSLNLDVRQVSIESNNVRLNLSLEYNPPETKAGEAPAPESSFQQSGFFVLENGRPVVVAQWPDPLNDRDRRVSVEVKGTIVK
jgi:hypothetical protein